MDEKEFNYKLLEQKILQQEKLSEQHDSFTKLAIEKAENSLTKQLSELTVAIESLAKRFEENIKSVTERNEEATRTMNDKVDTLNNHIVDKMTAMKSAVEDKRDTLITGIEQRILSNIKVDSERFAAVHKQMQLLIDNNADISNAGLKDLNKWKESTQGSIKVILAVGGFVVAIVLSLVIAFLNTLFK